MSKISVYFLFHLTSFKFYFQFHVTYLSSLLGLLLMVSEKLCLESKRSMSQLPDLLLLPQELKESFLSKSKSLSYLKHNKQWGHVNNTKKQNNHILLANKQWDHSL